jgi:hypothetical protein
MSMDEKPIFRCGLEITGTEHGEWQGRLQTDDAIQDFRSALKLLHLIHAEVSAAVDKKAE